MKNNSPLRYPGGKSALTPFIEIAVEHAQKSIYAEPFAGGAGVAINLLLSNKISRILLNDKDPAIYSIWNNIIFDTDRFVTEIQNLPVTMSEYEKQKAFYKANNDTPSFELGVAAFFLNRTNVSGVITGGPIGGAAQTGNYKLDCRFNKDALIKKIRKIGNLRSQIELYNMDVSDFLTQRATSDMFVYLDPPYVGKGKVLYKNCMDEQKHTELHQLLISAQYPWLISYDDCPFIRNLYSKCMISPVYLNYSAANKGISKEIIINP